MQKIKKILSLMVLGILVTSPLLHEVTSAATATFPDVPEKSAYFAAVEYLKAKGVIGGYPDGSFRPQQTINRAEALKIVLLAIDALAKSSQTTGSGNLTANPENSTSTSTSTNVSTPSSTATSQNSPETAVSAKPNFPDVTSKDWFYDYVVKGFQTKIIEGYPDGTFKPESNINLAESMKVIFRAFKVPLHPLPLAENPFVDANKDSWYAVYAQYAKDKQLVLAQDDGKLHAERDITRADFASIVYRLMYVEENQLDKFPLSKDWPTFVHPDDHYSVQYPFDWAKIEAGSQTIFWKQDNENGQVSFARVFPNSGTVVIAVDQNKSGFNLDEYLSKIQYDANAQVQKLTLNDYPFATITIPETGLRDYYFALPNKTILIVYSQVGEGPLKSQLQEEIRYIVGSVRYVEQGGKTLKEKFLSDVRQNVLVKGKGKTTLDLFPDATIIETDTIGIGTGPIDYYYSATYNVSLKYERNADMLLAIKEAKSSAF